MRRILWVGVLLLAFACPLRAVDEVDVPEDPGALIMTLRLPNPETQKAPYPFWVRTETGLMLEFPYPVIRVQGRGARVVRGELDNEAARAEWVVVPHGVPAGAKDVSEIPPPYTLWVNPQFESSQCVLHVTLGDGKIYTFQFSTPLKAPPGSEASKAAEASGAPAVIAYARVRFRPAQIIPPSPAPAAEASADTGVGAGDSTDSAGGESHQSPRAKPAPKGNDVVVRSEDSPQATLRDMTPEAEMGLLDFVRLLGSLPLERAMATARENPVIETVVRGNVANDTSTFGKTHQLRLLWVCRDSTSGALGFGVEVKNLTPFKLTFDSSSWAVRVGHGAIYEATAARGARTIAPAGTEYAQFVVARDALGDPLRLDAARNNFTPSVRLTAQESARPFQSFDVNIP